VDGSTDGGGPCNPSAPFGTPAPVTSLNSAQNECNLSLSADGLVAYFSSDRTDFGTPAAVAVINTTWSEEEPFLTADENTDYFESSKPGGLGAYDIYTSTKSGGTFSPSMPVGSLNISVAHRSTLSDGFGIPQAITELDMATNEWPIELSPDGCTLYFSSNRTGGAGGYDIFSATRGH